MSKEDNKYRQGKTKEQINSSYIGAYVGVIGVILSLLYLLFA